MSFFFFFFLFFFFRLSRPTFACYPTTTQLLSATVRTIATVWQPLGRCVVRPIAAAIVRPLSGHRFSANALRRLLFKRCCAYFSATLVRPPLFIRCFSAVVFWPTSSSVGELCLVVRVCLQPVGCLCLWLTSSAISFLVYSALDTSSSPASLANRHPSW